MANLSSTTRPHSAELYDRVKRVIPPPEWATFADDVDAILELKRSRNAVILAHNYQTPEIFHGVADIVGDSLLLAREATKVDADIIVLAGVHFMAETAKLLNPEKTVLIPDLAAGCSLADSITAQDVRLMRQRYPGVARRHLCQHLGRGEGGIRHLLHLGQCAQGRGVARRRARHHAAGRISGAEHRHADRASRSSRGRAIARCMSCSPPADIRQIAREPSRRHRAGASGVPARGGGGSRFLRLDGGDVRTMSASSARPASCC